MTDLDRLVDRVTRFYLDTGEDITARQVAEHLAWSPTKTKKLLQEATKTHRLIGVYTGKADAWGPSRPQLRDYVARKHGYGG